MYDIPGWSFAASAVKEGISYKIPAIAINPLTERVISSNQLPYASYLLPMSTGEEEERAYDDAIGPLFNARFECISYRRFSQLLWFLEQSKREFITAPQEKCS